MEVGEFKGRTKSGLVGASVLFLSLGWTSSPVFGGPVVYVNQAATGVGDGSSWTDAYTDLQPALDAAEASGGAIQEIWVAAGTYKPSKRTDPDYPRSATFQLIYGGVYVYGGFAGTEGSIDKRDIDANPTILSGDFNGDDGPDFVNYDENAYHVVTVDTYNPGTIIDGFTISGGYGISFENNAKSGGGMYIYAQSPTLTNCTIRGNNGGGIYNYSGSPTLSNCTFRGNAGGGMNNANGAPTLIDCTFSGNDGGGMNNSYGYPTLTNCTFKGNSSDGDGGGMSEYWGHSVLTNCTFSGNTAEYYGGGMENDVGSPTLTNCIFSGNTAKYSGGGMDNNAGSPTLTNCIFSGNTAKYSGGGMYNDSGYPTLTNCTFSGNSVNPSGMNNRGGGMYSSSGNPTLTNSILWGNTEWHGHHGESAQLYVYAGTPNVQYCDVEGWTGSLGGPQNWSNNPLFVDADGPDDIFGTPDDNLRLTAFSPCVDTGLNLAVSVTTDADGAPRIMDGDGDGTAIVDRGAYEFYCANNEECTDNDPCTIDECDVPRGVCINTPIECPAGQVCRHAECLDFCDVVDCNDHNVCTQDSCDAQSMRCVNTPNSCPEGVIFVNAKAKGANDGSSWADAYTDLQPALDAAEASGGAIREIWVAYGTYKPSKRTEPDDPRSATFRLIDGVSLYGGFSTYEDSIDERNIDANPTILSGDFDWDDGPNFVNYDENAYHVVTAIGSGALTIFDGLTVTSGHSPGSGFLGSYGGGMHMENAHLEIRNCTFTRNLAERPESNVAWSGGGGAALYLYQEQQEPVPPPLNVSRSRFTDNRSAGDGGAVFLHGNYETGSATFTECAFERNTGHGAVVVYDGGEQTFRSCTFSDNSSNRLAGGAIYTNFYDSELLIEQCRFEHNNAGRGGAVAIDGGRAVTIRESLFSDNSADNGDAGALYIYVNYNPSVIELVDTEFRGNSAGQAGGAYLYAHTSIPVQRCKFVDNRATDWEAGGLYVRGSASLSECNFFGNYALASGGGLFADGILDVTGCNFANNTSSMRGGGAFVYGYGTVSFVDSEFDQNWSDYGGAVYIDHAPQAILDRCRVEHNRASVGGGVAATASSTDVQLVNSLFAENQAEVYGGGVAGGAGPLTLTNCTITNNTAGALGGGIIVGRNATITNSIVWGNVVDPGGEAWTDEVAQIDGIEFTDIQYSNVQGWSGAYGGDGNIGLDPLFVEPLDPDGYYGPMEADYHLQAGSPCINTGLTPPIVDPGPQHVPPPPQRDLDGHARVLCGLIDMGAYEFGIGDYDCDREIDLIDFAEWESCATGPIYTSKDPPYKSTGPCSAFDFDADADIDLRDLAAFLQVFSPGSP